MSESDVTKWINLNKIKLISHKYIRTNFCTRLLSKLKSYDAGYRASTTLQQNSLRNIGKP